MKTVDINEIISFLPTKGTNIKSNYVITKLIQLDPSATSMESLFWCNDKNLPLLEKFLVGTVIVSNKITGIKLAPGLNYIIVDNPRLAFASLIRKYFQKSHRVSGIAKSAIVAKGVKLGKNVFIGEHVVIEEGCVIGDNTSIMHNTVISGETIIGCNVVIGCNNTIGGIGFGYEKSDTGEYEVIPHVGNVVIKDNVEIGSNTCIDRAVLGSTIINENVKIDNLVHVAHGVIIGANSLIIAHSMIGGSSTIGKNVWLAPGVLILNKVNIDNDAVVGMGAVVIRPVEGGSVVAGNPARFLKKAK